MKTNGRTLQTVVTLAFAISCSLVYVDAHGGCHSRRSGCHGHPIDFVDNPHRRFWRDFDVGFWDEPYLSHFNGITWPSLFDDWHDELLPRRRCLDSRRPNENHEYGWNDERPAVGVSLDDEEEARRRELVREDEQRRREEELERELEAQRQRQMERELQEREREIQRYREAERRRQEEIEKQRLRHEQQLESEREREREVQRLREWEREQEERELQRQKEMEREYEKAKERQRLRELEQRRQQEERERQRELELERERQRKLRENERLHAEGSRTENYRTEGEYNRNHLRELPSIELAKLQIEGYYPEDLKVSIENNKLKVVGKQPCACDKSCGQREFERVYKLPMGIQTETLAANLDANGLLVIRSDYDRFDTSKKLSEAVANVQGLGLPYSNPSKSNSCLEREDDRSQRLYLLDEPLDNDDSEVIVEVED